MHVILIHTSMLYSSILGIQEQWVHDKYDGRHDSNFLARASCHSTH